MRRRKMKRYRNIKKNSGVKFLGFFVIMISAVICGYLTARFVAAPLLGYDTEVLKLDFPSKLTALLEKTDMQEETSGEVPEGSQAASESEAGDSEPEKGSYVLQFGVFSTRSGAEERIKELGKESIDAKIREDGKQYKVISKAFETKEAALKELESLKEDKDLDVFITVIN